MQNKTQVYLGAIIIFIGLVILVANLTGISIWAYLWPILLIGIGAWLILRPQLVPKGTLIESKILGSIRRRGAWQVTNEEIWLGVGDVKLDFMEANIPAGETTIRIAGFVGDVNARLPEGVGYAIAASGVVIDTKINRHKREQFLTPLNTFSPNYETAERKIRLETTFFVVDLDVIEKPAEEGQV